MAKILGKSVAKYVEVENPIYIYQAGDEKYDDVIFSTENSGAMPLI